MKFKNDIKLHKIICESKQALIDVLRKRKMQTLRLLKPRQGVFNLRVLNEEFMITNKEEDKRFQKQVNFIQDKIDRQ